MAGYQYARDTAVPQGVRIRDNRCPVSMYLAVTALNLAVFGIVVFSQQIWQFHFISANATVADR